MIMRQLEKSQKNQKLDTGFSLFDDLLNSAVDLPESTEKALILLKENLLTLNEDNLYRVISLFNLLSSENIKISKF